MYINNFILNFKNDFIYNYQNTIAMIILTLFLLFNTYTDIKKFKIYNVSNLLLVLSRIALTLIPFISYKLTFNNVLGALFSFLIILIPAVILMYRMGGDIKLITAIGFYLGIYMMPIFIFLTLITALSYALIKKKMKQNYNKIPLAPFFLIAHVILYISYLVF